MVFQRTFSKASSNKDVVLQIDEGQEASSKVTNNGTNAKSTNVTNNSDCIKPNNMPPNQSSIKKTAPDVSEKNDTIISIKSPTDSNINNSTSDNCPKPRSVKKRASCDSNQEIPSSRSVSVKSKAPSAPTPADTEKNVKPEPPPTPERTAFVPGKSKVSGKVLEGWI
jgi:hypothetical protein